MEKHRELVEIIDDIKDKQSYMNWKSIRKEGKIPTRLIKTKKGSHNRVANVPQDPQDTSEAPSEKNDIANFLNNDGLFTNNSLHNNGRDGGSEEEEEEEEVPLQARPRIIRRSN